jgi:hypothetical protein
MTTAQTVIDRSALRHRITTAIVVLGLALSAVLIARVSTAQAYEGTYCNSKYLYGEEICDSSAVSNIRRAIGHSNSSWTRVYISTGAGEKEGKCTKDGCTAETGYLSKDASGYASIQNITAVGNTFFGYLYP